MVPASVEDTHARRSQPTGDAARETAFLEDGDAMLERTAEPFGEDSRVELEGHVRIGGEVGLVGERRRHARKLLAAVEASDRIAKANVPDERPLGQAPSELVVRDRRLGEKLAPPTPTEEL